MFDRVWISFYATSFMKALVEVIRFVRLVPLCLLVVLGVSSSAHGAAYIKFDGVDGEALAAGYEGWSDLDSITQNITRAVDPETDAIGRAELQDILCSKVLDRASPKLAHAIASGLVFPTVEIHLTRNAVGGGGQATYLKYKLENVQIVSYNLFGQASALAVNRENVSLNFEKITMTHVEYDSEGVEAGTVVFTWNKLTSAP